MKENKKLQCTRCRMGVPIGVIVALIGLAGIITCSMNFEATGSYRLFPYIALFIIGPAFARMASLVNYSHSRIDKLEGSEK